MIYTHSLCRAVTHTHTHTHSGLHTHTQKGAERQRQREACRDDLGFSCLSSATALLLKGAVQISHAGAHTNTHNHFSQLHREKQRKGSGLRENDREMYTTGTEREKTSHPRKSPFSFSPPPASITLCLHSLINLPHASLFS